MFYDVNCMLVTCLKLFYVSVMISNVLVLSLLILFSGISFLSFSEIFINITSYII